MSRVKELERELSQQRTHVGNVRDHKRTWSSIERKKDALEDELRKAASEAREERNKNRSRLVVIRDKIDVITKDDLVDDSEEALFNRLKDHQEILVDENESLTALIERLLIKVHRADRKGDHAHDLAKEFGDELDKSIDRMHRIHEQLERAKKRNDNPLDTSHFVLAEFDCHDGTPVPHASYDALKAHVHNYLLPLRAKYGTVHINSAFRTASYNASIGGAASMSIHVYDASYQHAPWAVAVDHVAANANPSQVQAWHEATTHPDGMGRYTTFTHCDNRNRIGWADSRWYGP